MGIELDAMLHLLEKLRSLKIYVNTLARQTSWLTMAMRILRRLAKASSCQK
jgi:dTDP-4-dehydrorhamnose reductase